MRLAPPLTEPRVRFGQPTGRWVLLASVLGSSLAMLDATVVNVALEQIGTDLGADSCPVDGPRLETIQPAPRGAR